MRIVYTLLLLITTSSVWAQYCQISGVITDHKKEPVINARIDYFAQGQHMGSVVTDFDGYYVLKPLDPGSYTVLATYPGFDSGRVDSIRVVSGDVPVNITLQPVKTTAGIRSFGWRPHLIKKPHLLIGKITDKHNKPVVGASIRLYCDTSYIGTFLSRENGDYGTFDLNYVWVKYAVENSQYYLTISRKGYKTIKAKNAQVLNVVNRDFVMQRKWWQRAD